MIEQPFQKTVENIQLPAPENKKPSNNYDEVETIGPTGEKVARRRFKPEALAGQPKEATVEERGPQGFKIFDRRNPASIAIDKEIKEKGVLVPEQKTAAPPETTPETTPETSNVMGAALEEQESRYSPDEKKEIGWEQKKESEVLLEDLNWTRSYHYMNAELILRQSRKTGRLLARVRERIFGPKQASQTDNSKEDIFVDSYKKPSAEINQEEKFRRNFVQAKLEYQKLLDKYTRAVLKEKKDELADEPDEKKKEGLLAEIKKDIFLAEEQRFVEASQNLLSVVDQERFGKWKAKIIEEPNNNIFEKLFDKASSYFGGNEPRAQASEREKTMMSSVDELLEKKK